jgi:O-antigen/teichoic acid export membrane protein
MTRIARNSLYVLTSQLSAFVTVALTSPYIVHTLGVNLYGVLVLVGITTNYFGIIELGLGQATVKFLADSCTRKDWMHFHRVLWTSSLSYLALGFVGATILVGSAPLLVSVLKIPANAQAIAFRAFLVSAVGLIVSLQVGLTSGALRALEKFEWLGRVGTIVGVAQALLSVGLLHLGYSLVGVMVGGVALQALALVAYTLGLWVFVPGLGCPTWDRETFRELLGFGAYVSISQAVGPLLVHLEKFILSGVVAIGLVTYYTVPFNVIATLSFLPRNIALVIFPAFTRLYCAGQHETACELYLRTIKLVFGSVVPVAILIGIFAPQILTLWMGADFSRNSSGVMRMLAFALVLNAVAASPYQFLQAIDRADLTAKFHLFELVLHIPLCLVLIHAFGLLGAALAWAVRVTVDLALLLRSATVAMGIGLRELFLSSFRATIVGALLGLPIPILASLGVRDAGRAITVLIIGLAGFAYFVIVAATTLDGQDKSYLVPLWLRRRGSVVT